MGNVCEWIYLSSLIVSDNNTKVILLGLLLKLKWISNFNVTVRNSVIETCHDMKCLGLIINWWLVKVEWSHH